MDGGDGGEVSMLRRLALLFILAALTQGNVRGCPRSFIHSIFTQPYILLGDYYYGVSKYDSALFSYLIPYKLLVENNNKNRLIDSLNYGTLNSTGGIINDLHLKIGKVYCHLGEYHLSIEFLEMTLTHECSQNDFELLGNIHYYLGMSYNKTHDYSKSLFHYLKSYESYSKVKSDSSDILGFIYCDIGNVHYNKEDYGKAIEYYNLSYDILSNQKEPNYSKLSIIKNNIGSIHYRLQDINKAIEHYKMAIYLNQKGIINHFDQSMYLNNLAGIYLSIGNTDSAEFYYKKSLRIRETYLKNNILLVQTHNHLGALYLFTSNFKSSLYHFQQALILNSINFSDTLYFANPSFLDVKDYMQFGISLYFKAIVFNNIYKQNKYINVSYLYESYKAIDCLISFFAHIFKVEQNPEKVLAFLDFNRDVINAALDIYNENSLEDENKWFSIIQQGKSILLYQHFLELKAKNFANIPDSHLLKEKSIRKEIFEYDRLIESALISGMDFTDIDGFTALISSRNKKVYSLDSLVNIFETEYPQYYQIKFEFKPKSLEVIQEELNDHEVILEYHITDSLIYLTCLTRNYFLIHSENTDSTINILHDHLKGIKFYNNVLLFQTGTYLYNKLIGPFDSVLSRCSRAIIIPDEELSLFPFETLIISNESRSDKYKYLIEDFEVSYHFSTSLWYESKRMHDLNENAQSLLAFAPLNFNNKDTPALNLPSLNYTEKETTSLEQIFVNRGLKTLCLLDTNATKSNFLTNQSDYSIIHLATHHTYYFDMPDLSGIVFSKGKSETTLGNSNVLNTKETYNLDLNANLVVLSACMTGMGEVIKGEGLITLYRGFFYSGARNILFTLWNAPDKYTFKFMITFYNSLFEGKSYSCSLRNAKLSFLHNEKTKLPVFWSNYLILGN